MHPQAFLWKRKWDLSKPSIFCGGLWSWIAVYADVNGDEEPDIVTAMNSSTRSRCCCGSSMLELDGATSGLSGWRKFLALFPGIDPIHKRLATRVRRVKG